MHSHSIKDLLELCVRSTQKHEGYILIDAVLVASHQPCPVCALNLVAIVMDLANVYHKFTKTMYPAAIRIADRYHVNRYVTEALKTVRKSIPKELLPVDKKDLKKNFRVLGKRNDQLTTNEQIVLQRLFSYNPFLQHIYLLTNE